MNHIIVFERRCLFCLLVKSVVRSSWAAGPNKPNPISISQLESRTNILICIKDGSN